MNLDVKAFKKVKEDERTATLRHPKGHEIRIAKKSLKGKLRKELDSLPLHLDEGGPVSDPTEDASANASSAKTGQPINITVNAQPSQADSAQVKPSQPIWQKAADWIQQNPNGSMGPNKVFDPATKSWVTPPTPAPAASAPMPSSPAPASVDPGDISAQAPPPPQDTYGTDAFADSYTKGLQAQAAGIQGIAKAQGAQSAAEASAIRNDLPAQQGLLDKYQQEFGALDNERRAMMQDLQNQHIDPNRYIDDMSTGKKVLTGIGILLGGIGGQGHGNQVMDVLRQNIQQDIDAQKSELGKKENLLSNNLRQFGNVKDASDFLRLQHNDILAHKIKLAAAQNGGSLAQANAQLAIGKLQQDSAGVMQMIASRRALQGPQGSQVDPALAARMLITDPKEKETATKEIAAAQEIEKLRSGLLGSFNDLHGKAFAGALSPNDRESAIQAFAGPLAKMSEGRFNLEESKKQIGAILPAPTDTPATVKNKLARLNQLLDIQKNTPVLDSYRIAIPKMGAPLTRNQQALQWAKANPNEPMSKEILAHLGVR